jgi:hypothetical protein
MTTFLLLWNPAQWPHDNILRLLDQMEIAGSVQEEWRFRAVNQVEIGDDVLVYKTGKAPRGVFGTGTVMSGYFKRPGSDGKVHNMVRVRFDRLVDPFYERLVAEEDIVSRIQGFSVGFASGGHALSADVERILRRLLDRTRLAASRAVAKTYRGESLPVHPRKLPSLAKCIARIRRPNQRATKASLRDLSLLCLIAQESLSSGLFDPSSERIAADIGVISRLASLYLIETDGVACFLNARGRTAAEKALSERASHLSATGEESYATAVRELGATEREALVKQRIGQTVFKRRLMEYWNARCCLSGISEGPLLRASHIVAWSRCDSDHHRLDVHNGLLLAAHLDAAFDAGLMTIDDNGCVVLSPALTPQTARHMGLSDGLQIAGLTKHHRQNLRWHRAQIFRSL